MALIITGTVCPYPFTFPPDVLNGTSDDCTVTYAEHSDPAFLILQVVLAILFGGILLPLYLHRLYQLHVHAKYAGVSMFALVQFKLYFSGVIISGGMVLEAIDPYGARNVVTPHFYFLIDQIVAGTLFIIALLIVEFYVVTSQSGKSLQKGLPVKVLAFGIGIIYVDFVGTQIVSMIVPEYYAITKAVRLYGAAMILLIYCWISYKAKERILETLRNSGTDSSANLSLRAALSCKYPSNITARDRTILTVKRKFCEWYAVVIFGVVALIVISTIDSGILKGVEAYAWTLEIGSVPDKGFYVFKTLYALGVIIVLRLFKVPSLGSHSAQQRLGSRTTTKTNFKDKTGTENYNFEISAGKL